MSNSATSNFLNFILDLFFPAACFGCGQESSYVCRECLEKIKINNDTRCFVCGRHTIDGRICRECSRKTNLAGVFVASFWDNQILRQLIYEYKYRFIKGIAGPLSRIIIRYFEETNRLADLPTNKLIFVSVPLHRQRLQWRGFNQAELLAQKVADYFDAPLVRLLERARDTRPQAELKRQKDRKDNIKKAFSLSKTFLSLQSKGVIVNNFPLLKDKIIIIVDDIATTGSTLEECAAVLKALRPKEIWGLVLARG